MRLDFASGSLGTTIDGTSTKGLGELERLIEEARAGRAALAAEVRAATRASLSADRKLRLAQLIVVRLLLQGRIEALARTACDANIALSAAQDRQEACAVSVHFDFNRETMEKFAVLHERYETLRASAMLWGITTPVEINRRKERTTATHELKRQPLRLDVLPSNLIASSQEVLRLPSALGEAHIYPAFMMLRDGAQGLTLTDIADLKVEYANADFIEEGTVPPDAEILSQAWKRANKDGSRDKRFSENYEIPLVRYGELTVSTPSGSLATYQTSRWQSAKDFANAVEDCQWALAGNVRNAPPATQTAPSISDDPLPTFTPPATPNFVWDYTLLTFIAVSVVAAALWL